MQASSMQFALNPCSNNEESTKILSFKINNQLEALIEHKKDNLNLEIEFSSATEGKIYHGTTSFDLKISKCNAVVIELFQYLNLFLAITIMICLLLIMRFEFRINHSRSINIEKTKIIEKFIV